MPKKSRDEKERKLMKSLYLGIVGDTGGLLADEGFNKPINVLELIVFGMFIVTESYALAKKESDKGVAQLDQFHLDMVNYVTNEYFLKEHVVEDTSKVFEFQDGLYDIIASRYAEYRAFFREDLSNPNTIFSKTLDTLMNHLFDEPISEDDKPYLIVPMAAKLAEFYTGCVQSFK